MCRMIGFVSIAPRDIAPYFGELQHQARDGVGSPHKTGWGYAVYGQATCCHKTFTGPVFEQTYDGPPTGYAALLHARKASPKYANTAVDPECLHPFQFTVQGVTWSFAHNGTINNMPQGRHEATDSKMFVDLIEEHMNQGATAANALRSVAAMLKTDCDPTSLNCLLVSRGECLVLRSSDDDHKLYCESSGLLFVASTEVPRRPLSCGAGTWTELSQDHVIHGSATRNRIEYERLSL